MVGALWLCFSTVVNTIKLKIQTCYIKLQGSHLVQIDIQTFLTKIQNCFQSKMRFGILKKEYFYFLFIC